MKNKIVRQLSLAIILLAAFLVSAAGAQKSGTPAKPAKGTAASSVTPETGATANGAASADKVVMKVGASQVTQSEIDSLISNLNPQAQQTLAAQGRRPLGDEYVKVLLLSHQAVNDHLESSPEIHRRLELQRVQMLAQAEYEKMASEVKVSSDEIGQYFTAHKPEYDAAQVREFVVRKKPLGAKDGTVGLTAEEAKTKAESIRKALTAGTDPKKVAQDFAVPNVVMSDPEPRTIRRGQLLPALDKAAFELKDGEVSDSLDTPQALVFLQIVGHHHADQKEVAPEIENTLRQQKLEAELAGLRNKTDVWMDEDYFKGQTAAAPASPQQPPAAPPAPKP
jgi:parvulin-like peptidyl-prolyl isomerase